MQADNDDNFDLQLREHFAKELDGQLGRAPAAFARSSRRRPWRVALWGTGLAAAASVALILSLDRNVPHPAVELTNTQLAATAVEYQSAWQTTDDGTIYLDQDVPMRSIRRQEVETVRWVDPATKAMIELTIPREQIVLVTLNSY